MPLALIEAWRAGLFARAHWARNLLAGVIVGVVALPLAMAFAIASGARPEHGIYTAIVAGVVVSLCGGSRLQIAGPTGAFVAILAGITANYGIAGLQIATLMAGLMLVAMGVARLGTVIRFIPAPVIAGFTAGIGVVIFVGQWADFLGLPQASALHFHDKLAHAVLALPSAHLPTVALGVGTLAVLLISPHVPGLRKVPAPLVGTVLATLAVTVFEPEGIRTIGTAFGGLPSGLPAFEPPSIEFADIPRLVGPAFTIAMLGAIESLLSAVVADGMAGTRHDSNQELVGQGLANIAAPLFGGFAATGAIARTATSIRNGATSPLAGVTHALVLVAVLLVLAPLAARIPLAALAAILFVVAWNMSDVPHVRRILARAPIADRVILLVTFFLTVFVDLVVAVNVGVVLAMLQFVRRMVETTEVEAVPHAEVLRELDDASAHSVPEGVAIYEIAGPMFFGAIENVEQALLRTLTLPNAIVLRMHRVPFIDFTGIDAIERIAAELESRGVHLVLCEANERVRAKLRAAGVSAVDESNGYRDTLDAALRALAQSPALDAVTASAAR